MDAMILFPAIDLKDGQCVRLKRGAMADATVFNSDPAAQAKLFEAQGFCWLHCVDLNGAFAGRSVNSEAVRAVRAATALPIQLGGGIRSRAQVEAWLEAGITRVILGTAALTDPGFVKEVARAHPGRIVVGADARAGRIATRGWAETSEIAPVELGKRFEDAGVAAILFTDIDSDGMLGGLNVEATVRLARRVTIPVIASGGAGSLADIRALMAASEPNVQGVVLGRALYDGRIVPGEALALAG
ncbi:MAG: 1-(5-phosphoribosyl)-5-[(5-phosphoribosylamino)methylideneamino]imidazole-4-carboxamide isomerase [Rhizomicrobium sp.]